MLCGAGDTKDILPYFELVAKDLGFQPLNYLKGKIKYHNYGENRWEENSRLTVNNADLLVFVINSHYGKITWNIEFEEALSTGKNFMVFCNEETFTLYRQLTSNRVPFPETDDNKSIKEICQLIQKLELDYQITIIPFELINFQSTFKSNLLNLFEFGLRLVEKENRKNGFLPILLSSKFNDPQLIENHLNEDNERICKDILFDVFENKNIRKKALEYFRFSKSLSDEEIINLCLDSEQGISRKTITLIGELISKQSDLDKIFEEVIQSISNEEVGVVRRGIVSLFKIDLERSIRYFHLFLPSNDVGTPKRIIMGLNERTERIDLLISKKSELGESLNNLINFCLKHHKDGSDWKKIGNSLLKKYKDK